MVEQNKELSIIAQDITANLHRLLSSLPSGERLSSIEYNHHQSEWIAASAIWAEEDRSQLSYHEFIGEEIRPHGAWVRVGEATGSTIADAIRNLVEDRAK